MYHCCMRIMFIVAVFLLTKVSVAQPLILFDQGVDAYLANYAQWFETVPESDRAWEEMTEIDSLIVEFFDGRKIAAHPQNENWDECAEFVKNNQDMVIRIREYANRPVLGMPIELFYIDPEMIEQVPPAYGFQLPYLAMVYRQSKLLTIDAILASRRGEPDRVVSDVHAIISIQKMSSLMNVMVEFKKLQGGICLFNNAILDQSISLADWPISSLVALASEYERIEMHSKSLLALSGEKEWLASILKWVFVDHVEGALSQRGLMRIMNLLETEESNFDTHKLTEAEKNEGEAMRAFKEAIASWISPLQEQKTLVETYFSYLDQALKKPFHDVQSHKFDVYLNQMESNTDYEYLPTFLFIPDGLSFVRFVNHSKSKTSATVFHIALEHYKAKHGFYPELNVVDTAELFNGIPTDMFSGEPLKYKIVNGQPMIYSVGTDRDDDGGRSIAGRDQSWVEFLTLDEVDERNENDAASIDGDWILYPAKR